MCYYVSTPTYTELEELLDNAIRADEWDQYYHYMNGYDHFEIPWLLPDTISNKFPT